MKLTKSQLKEIIREEILQLKESMYNKKDIPKPKEWTVKFYRHDVRYIHKKTKLIVDFDFTHNNFIKWNARWDSGRKIDFIKSPSEIKGVLDSIPFDKINIVN